jgi:hypothetical protein
MTASEQPNVRPVVLAEMQVAIRMEGAVISVEDSSPTPSALSLVIYSSYGTFSAAANQSEELHSSYGTMTSA